MDQWSKTTSYFKQDSDTLQHGELRSNRGSWLVKFVLWIFISFKDTYETSHGSSSERTSFPSMDINMAHSLWFDLSTFYVFLFLLSVTVFFFHHELFSELLYEGLHRSATNESEDTSDVFHCSTFIGPTVGGKHAWQQDEEIKEDSSTVLMLQEQWFIFRVLQRHSGRILIDPSIQDNVVIPSNFFQHIYHIGCAFNLHSIINLGSIPGGQSSSKRQTVFFLPVDPMDKNHKDPEIDLNVPRHAQYLHKAWKRHQDAVYWVDINLAINKGLTFYQTRSNAIIFQETLPAYCIPKVVRMETGEVWHEKVDMSPRRPSQISLKNEWKRELGSEHAQRSEIGQSSGSFQSNQPNLNPIRERTERPVITHDVIGVQDDERKTSRLRRSRLILFAKNLVLQSERCDLLRQM